MIHAQYSPFIIINSTFLYCTSANCPLQLLQKANYVLTSTLYEQNIYSQTNCSGKFNLQAYPLYKVKSWQVLCRLSIK